MDPVPGQPLHIPVDRITAIVGGLWRLGISLAIFGLLYRFNMNWRLMWQTQPATCLAFGTLYATLIGTAAAILVGSMRKLLLGCWPSRLFIVITSCHINIHAGPWGSNTYPWSAIKIDFEPHLDWEEIEQLPEKAVVLKLRHSQSGEDLAEHIQRLAGIDSERLFVLMRPYLNHLSKRNTHNSR